MPNHYILIDLRPAIDLSIENAILITDLIVIPVDMDKRAIKGIDDLLEVVKEVKQDDDIVYTLVCTKIDKRNKKMRDSTRQRIAEGAYQLAKTEIRISELYKQATESKRPVIHFSPDSKPHKDYMNFTKELIELGAHYHG